MTEASGSSVREGGIVVGVDGSPLSITALRWAARLEPTVGGPIRAVAAWHLPTSGVAFAPYTGLEWNPETDATEILENALTEAYGDHRPEGLTAAVVQGFPAKVLLDQSRGASMVLVGSRGLGGFMGLLLGSVSRAVAEHAQCPVMVVHAPGDEDHAGQQE